MKPRESALSVILVVALLLGLAGCANPAAERQADALPPPAEELDEGLVEANTVFALNLMNELNAMDPDGSLFLSPASISLALAMAYNGADGETFEAMARTLGLYDLSRDRVNRAYADLLTILQNPDPEVQMLIANSIWAREGLPFEEDFLETNREFFGTEVEELDFDDPEASEIINDWVRDATRDLIDGIVPDDIDPDTIMFLINAMYFNGDWTLPFDPDDTRDDAFHLPGGGTSQMPFMNQSGDFRHLDGEGFEAVALPYGEERLSMYLFLPDEGVGIESLMATADAATWRGWMDAFFFARVHIALPRFEIESEVGLRNALENMGMEVAFDAGRADFSRMYPISPGERAYISDVKHKAFIEVTEEGTEAAAATSVEFGVTSVQPAREMRFDRPFLFAISDDVTGSILFMGIMRG